MATIKEVVVPDIGDYKAVDVIEVLVKPGDRIQAEDSLIALESDKATMEVPAPFAGVVKEVKVKVGDKVAEGSLVLMLEVSDATTKPATPPASEVEAKKEVAPVSSSPSPSPVGSPKVSAMASQPQLAATPIGEASFSQAHASPSVRRFARELGADLGQIKGTGPKGRIIKEDVQAFVKVKLAQSSVGAGGGGGLNLLDWPQVDFAKFGSIASNPLSRIKKISGANLHRNWVMIPHVTQFDEADITELEAFRKDQLEPMKQQGVKLTPLVFLIKAAVAALKRFPDFNASLDESGENLIYKQYYHIGFAADTPNGLVVPVIRNADQKGLVQLAKELGELSALARDGKLKPSDMQGGCFSISSLGGVGGTAFTPIINAPEVAILGVSKSTIKPVYKKDQFVPRLILPLSLSYDHRVIDGASAARFTTYLAELLSDIRRLVL